MGFEVYQATSSVSAIDIFKRTPDISLLLTDVVMPGELNGVQSAQQILKMDPTITIIYVSGFPLGNLKDKEFIKVEGHFLNKPYQRDELISMIKKIMNKS